MAKRSNDGQAQPTDPVAVATARIEEARANQSTQLDLSDLGLIKVPESIGQLSQLQSLDLSGNRLTTVPESLGQLSQLRSLDLFRNWLTTLPGSLGLLSRFLLLDLSRNQLTTVPESLGQLSQLQSLDLSGNRLRTVPESLGQLSQLRSLDLRYNYLHALPISLKQLTNLEKLYLHHNAELGLPPEVLGPEPLPWISRQSGPPIQPSELLAYCFRVRLANRPLNEAKLILVGRGGVGKTSLVNRLVHDQFQSNEKKTEGIQITHWPIRLDTNEDVQLHIWDFGGQEIMHATHQFFLTRRSLYLLVLNGREGGEDADAEYWLKLIESFGGESPVIVVLNKIREHPCDLNRRALQQKYPGIRAFVSTDCQDSTGLDTLRQTIKSETDRLQHLRDPFPASWFDIKDRLAQMQKNYVGFDEYRAFCQQHGETDSAAQESLATYLHHLGIVLNFKDDPRLQDTHVLNPHWVTNGIYKILNSDKLARQKGDIHLRDIPTILDPAVYPQAMRCFIFDLMKKFDLCFSFPDDEFHYLIPELLDKQESPDTAAFPAAACLKFQYHYPILPEGLLPRFIVRTHHLSTDLSRWRTGVILQFEENQALIKADVQDKRVDISVAGPADGRRRLLAVIRAEFERIHSDIQNLQPAEMVPLPGHPAHAVPYDKLLVLEQNAVQTFPEVVGKKLLHLDVQTLLNGVDLEGTRRREQWINTHQKPAIRVFYSYAHKDERHRDQLETHLKLLQRQGLIETWHDRKIGAGDEWKAQIDANLERADIILLLISADFIKSDYCYDKEMKRALERHEQRSAYVIPVIVRDVNWRIAPFAKLQALPKDGKAVPLWPNKDTAWRNVSEGLQRIVEEMREGR